MKLQTKLLGSLALSGLLLASFSGCGEDSTTTDTSLTGYYIDSAVDGVDYTTTSGKSGTTGVDGAFRFNSGDSATFKVGDLVLRTQASLQDGAKVYETDDRAITFLQSVDLDGNASNGITLTKEIKAVIATWLNGATSVDINTSNNKIANIEALKTALVNAGITNTQNVDVITARAHVAEVAVAAALEGVAAGDEIPFGDGAFSPYERVAIFPTVKDAEGNLDHNATYAKVAELANTFAKYVANTNEPVADSATFKGANWIVAGYESTDVATDINLAHHILGIPTKKPINPNYASSAANTKKVKVVEVCNSTYASKALGVVNVGGATGAKVQKGIYHTTALPCEVTIYNDENGIYVDMLNPETIFTLFFTEVFGSAEMSNEAFRTDMMALPTQVKDEIFAMIYNAFDGTHETYSKTSIKMGTIYSAMSKAVATTDTASGGKKPYMHYSYEGNSTTGYTYIDAKNIAAKIISVMTSDADGVNVGIQESALKTTLPSTIAGVNPSWRSGRLEPLKVPGGSWIVEACSPTYAKEALTTGEYHTPALPCEIAVFVNPENNTTIDISFLNPEFMFGAMFADGMEKMTNQEIAAFDTIINNINGDLKKIVDYAMEHNVTGFDGTNTEITPVQY
jgi:uncharacterized protein (DUF302 family)